MQRIQTLIVDDEPLGRKRIRNLLKPEADIDVVGECANGDLAVQAIREHRPDLLFLDVQMPLRNGFEVLEAVGAAQMPAVIFVTAYDQHALRAFDVHALDYLLKPFDRDRFYEALQRARRHLQRESLAARSERLTALLADVQGAEPPTGTPACLTRLAVKEAGQILFLDLDDVDWIGAAGNYVTLHVGGRRHLLRETMNRLSARLDPSRFRRVHRSTIVRLDRVKAVKSLRNGEYRLTLHDGTRLHASRSYRDEVQVLLGKELR